MAGSGHTVQGKYAITSLSITYKMPTFCESRKAEKTKVNYKKCNVKPESTIQPILYCSRPTSLQIFSTSAIMLFLKKFNKKSMMSKAFVF